MTFVSASFLVFASSITLTAQESGFLSMIESVALARHDRIEPQYTKAAENSPEDAAREKAIRNLEGFLAFSPKVASWPRDLSPDQFPQNLKQALLSVAPSLVAGAELFDINKDGNEDAVVVFRNEKGREDGYSLQLWLSDTSKNHRLIPLAMDDLLSELRVGPILDMDNDHQLEVLLSVPCGGSGSWENSYVLELENGSARILPLGTYDLSGENQGELRYQLQYGVWAVMDADKDGIAELVMGSRAVELGSEYYAMFWPEIIHWNGKNPVRVTTKYRFIYDRYFVPYWESFLTIPPEEDHVARRADNVRTLLKRYHKTFATNTKRKSH